MPGFLQIQAKKKIKKGWEEYLFSGIPITGIDWNRKYANIQKLAIYTVAFSQVQWRTVVILATQEVDAGGLEVPGQPEQLPKILSQNEK